MKQTQKTILAALLAAALFLSGCASLTTPEPAQTQEPVKSAEPAKTQEPAQSPDSLESPEPAPSEEPAIAVEMQVYNQAPNGKSTVKIEYPRFTGVAEDVNALIYEKAESLAQLDTSFFPEDAALDADYRCAVTLQNSKVLSMVFWGSSNIEGSAHPTTNLYPLNIDLASAKELTLFDLYDANAEFSKVFFEKAAFPTDPVTSYDEASFPEMLKMQSPEYQTIDPFTVPESVSCFLKPEGVVLSMPAIHATGSDHFEAQLAYEDIQAFYLPSESYWTEG